MALILCKDLIVSGADLRRTRISYVDDRDHRGRQPEHLPFAVAAGERPKRYAFARVMGIVINPGRRYFSSRRCS